MVAPLTAQDWSIVGARRIRQLRSAGLDPGLNSRVADSASCRHIGPDPQALPLLDAELREERLGSGDTSLRSTAPSPARAGRSAGRSAALDVRRKQLAQTCGVLPFALDFMRLGVERERHRLVPFAAVNVVCQPDRDHLRRKAQRDRVEAGPWNELQHARRARPQPLARGAVGRHGHVRSRRPAVTSATDHVSATVAEIAC